MPRDEYERLAAQVYDFAFEAADSRESVDVYRAGRAAAAATNAFLVALREPEPDPVGVLDPQEFANALCDRTRGTWSVHSHSGPDAFTVRHDPSGLLLVVFRLDGQRRLTSHLVAAGNVPADPWRAAEMVAIDWIPVEILRI